MSTGSEIKCMRLPRSPILLLLCIAVCQAAGLIGSIFTDPKIGTWFSTLVRPGIAPPNWLFGPVWITLYFLMGVALYLVLREREKQGADLALFLFAVQLILNASWSYFFFGLESTFLGFLVLLAVWAAVVLTIAAFARISRNAALLLVPYIAWVTFAGIVAYQFWVLNP